MDMFTQWSGAVQDLLHTPNSRWSQMQQMQTDAVLCELAGTLRWSELVAKVATDDYASLFDLGVKYQLVAQSITLAEMYAFANQDAVTGALAVTLEACFVAWTGAYFIGLLYDKTAQPSINCGS